MYEFLDDDRFQSFAFEARGQAQRLLPGPAQADPDAVDRTFIDVATPDVDLSGGRTKQPRSRGGDGTNLLAEGPSEALGAERSDLNGVADCRKGPPVIGEGLEPNLRRTFVDHAEPVCGAQR